MKDNRSIEDASREIRKQLKRHIPKMSDKAIDNMVNLTGKNIDEKKRKKLKKGVEAELIPIIEEAMARSYQAGLQLIPELQQQKLDSSSLRDQFYKLTDITVKPLLAPNLPKSVHVFDFLFNVCEDMLTNFRFDWRFLKNTGYNEYLQSYEKLVYGIYSRGKINEAWQVLNEFRDSADFHVLLQVTFQKAIKYYEFLEQNFPRLEKKQVDKYLEIYEELSGIYEKFISLLSVLIELTQNKVTVGYEATRKRGLFGNINHVEKSGWGIFVSGFNRKMRNAITHKTFSMNIIKRTVLFIDRGKTMTLTFRNVQKQTRELGALLLILPSVFVSVFCLSILSLKDMLDNISEGLNRC